MSFIIKLIRISYQSFIEMDESSVEKAKRKALELAARKKIKWQEVPIEYGVHATLYKGNGKD